MSKPKYSQNFIRLASLVQAADEIPGVSIVISDNQEFGKFIDGMTAVDKMDLLSLSTDENGINHIKFAEEVIEKEE
jgi:hypothetical protein